MTVYEYNVRLNELRMPILREGAKYKVDARIVFNNPERVQNLASEILDLESAAEEYCYVLALDNKCKLKGLYEVGHGTVDVSIVDVRGIFQKALFLGASKIILMHNHPSGDPTPSEDDVKLTQRVKIAGEILDIQLLDHVVVGYRNYKSLKEIGLM